MPDAYGVVAALPLGRFSSPRTLLVPQSACGEEKFRVKRPKIKVKIKIKTEMQKQGKRKKMGELSGGPAAR
ncbi:MAG: hypothetical protein FWE35_28405 [Streptosporangiales bacterium]|nr:hypothetical protein [Streptosporangiales bacterium]